MAYQFNEELLVNVGKLSKLLISQNVVNLKIRDKNKRKPVFISKNVINQLKKERYIDLFISQQ